MTKKIPFESPIFALCAELAKLGKASQKAHNPGGWLILKALLKNGVAEGVASDPHDPSAGEALAKPRFLDLPALASGAFDS